MSNTQERQVKISYSLYRDLVHFFLAPDYEENWDEVEARIRTALREKQEAAERRMMYSAKLAAEKAGGLPQRKRIKNDHF